MNWKIKIAKRVLKQLKRIPKKDAQRLLFVLEAFSENPFQGDIAKIEGERNIWRRRVGNYRIFFEIWFEQKFVSILDIKRKTTATYR